MKSHKKEHSSKHKNKKSKKEKRKQETRSSSSSESEGDGMEWVEAPATVAAASTAKRDDWMNTETFVSALSKEELTSGSSSREKKKAIQKEKREKEEEIISSRELNPHWKDNGTGLPQEEKATAQDLSLPTSSVGDGGYNYLCKAYQRIQEQAQEQGKSMEEIAVERWGSLSKLVSMIDEAEQRMKSLARNRYGGRGDRDGSRKSPSSSERFRAPRRHTPSPDRSAFRYQKPRDERRHRQKVNVSSSRDRKPGHYAYLNDSDDEKSPPRRSSAVVRSMNDSRSSEKELREEKRVPAWKKIKPDQKQIPVQGSRDTPPPIQSDPPSSSRGRGPRSPSPQPQPPAPDIRSEDDLNRLAAKYLKADLMGDTELAARLKSELEEARARFKEGRAAPAPSTSGRREAERVMLTKVDSSGAHRPVQSSREDAGFDRRSEKSQKRSTKYIEDASRYSLKQMFEREKLTTAEENLEMFLDVAAQANDMDEENETSGISKKAMHKMAHGIQEEKDIGRAIRQHQKLGAALEKCEYCMDQPKMKRHLIVSISEEVYLCLPNFQPIAEGHCLIVPKRHVSSFLNLDEDEWIQVEELRGLLRRFFRDQQKSLVCLETSSGFSKCPHAYMECVPVPEEEGDMAPLYFKKAILESEEEWAHNVKLVDLTSKGLRRSVPKNLPYFCVLFDPAVHAGYAHVIEDEKCFPRNFGKEVLGGMLDIDYNFLYKNRKDDALKKSTEALEFTRHLEKFKEEHN